jgi:acetyl esterase
MEPFDLDLEYRQFIERYLEVCALSTTVDIKQQRIDYQKIVDHFRYPHPAGVITSDSSVKGRHGPVPVRHYRYQNGNNNALLLFLHGGGFILGSLDSHDDICAEICARTGFDLISVNYRHSPEHHHPVHLDDIEDAFVDCAHNNTILVGVSAGAALAAALSYRLRNGPKKAAGQVLIYPGLGGDSFGLKSYQQNANAPLLTTADVSFYRTVRCKNGIVPLQDPEFFPLQAKTFDGIAPTIVISADVDPLRDDAALYVEKLKAAQINAEWINQPGLTHDFLRARHISQRAREAFTDINDAITRLVNKAAAETST